MKNITLSADHQLIELAREAARTRKTTLNALFREWLEEIARRDERRNRAEQDYAQLAAHISAIPRLTREAMNER